MGCGASTTLPVGVTGYGMGGSPAHSKMKQTAKKEVAILWDMDDVMCPPTKSLCRATVEGLRKVSSSPE